MPRSSAARVASLALILGATRPRRTARTTCSPSPSGADYKATARHAEVVALCEALAKSSPLIRLAELGKSGEGRSLPLMIVADPPVSTPAEARASGKLVVFLFGNIHAGEVDGKEALPMLVREIVARPGSPAPEAPDPGRRADLQRRRQRAGLQGQPAGPGRARGGDGPAGQRARGST